MPKALTNSVNWYFQHLDQEAGLEEMEGFLRKIGYGNSNIGNDIKHYWMESTLKISPLEQVEILHKFYNNEFDWREENVEFVKKSMLLSVASKNKVYGKTGTGNVNGENINGWFIGFVETEDNVFFFASNIENKRNASGSKAAEITLSILSDFGII